MLKTLAMLAHHISLVMLVATAVIHRGSEAALSTAGRYVVESEVPNKKVQLACVNWYGIDQKDMVVGGLDKQPLAMIANLISELGFNCVRLPISLQAVLEDPLIHPSVLSANPEFDGQRAVALMDAVVGSLARVGLYVIIDAHTGVADWCCDVRDGDGLWYSDRFSEAQWIRALSKLATRYANEPLVVGIELRNEIRPC